MSHPLQAKDWQTAYAWVELKARGFLDPLPPGESVSTTVLADWIAGIVEHPATAADNKRIFKALANAATHGMQRYVTVGELEQIGPRKGRRKFWHRPGAEIIAPNKPVCGECGKPL